MIRSNLKMGQSHGSGSARYRIKDCCRMFGLAANQSCGFPERTTYNCLKNKCLTKWSYFLKGSTLGSERSNGSPKCILVRRGGGGGGGGGLVGPYAHPIFKGFVSKMAAKFGKTRFWYQINWSGILISALNLPKWGVFGFNHHNKLRCWQLTYWLEKDFHS